MSTFSTNIDLLSQYLSMRDAAHEVIASNIANAETPEYKSKIPSFSFKLDQMSQKANEAGFLNEASTPTKIEMKVLESKADAKENGNNVKLNHEMAAMSENSLLYMGALKILNKELALTKYAINNLS